MSDFVDEQSSQYVASLEQLKKDSEKDFRNLNDPISTVRAVCLSLSNFIDQNFELVTGNENMVEVNTILITALAQIKNYLLSEPSRVTQELNNAKSKYEAYDQCLKIFKDTQVAVNALKEDSTVEIESESDILESEVQIGKNSDVVVSSDLNLEEKPAHEELWNKPSEENKHRRVGQRPESLRKIRQEMFKNQGDESQPEDI